MIKKIAIATMITSVLGALLILIFPRDSHSPSTTNFSNLPDIYLRDVNILAFNPNGTIAYKLSAEAIEQFSAHDTIRLKQLNLLVERADGEQWHMSAQEGLIQPEPNQPSRILEPVQLMGTVAVYSGAVDDPKYSFRGSDVIYDPRNNSVHSEKPSAVKAGTTAYDADGFHFDLTTKDLSLRSTPGNQVKIQHDSDEKE